MLASKKYSQTAILLSGNPIPINLTALTTQERVFVTIKDGFFPIHQQAQIADYATGFNCTANRPIVDYLQGIEFPDFSKTGFQEVPDYSKEFTITYKKKADTSDTILEKIRVARAKADKRTFAIVGQNMLSKSIDWHTNRPYNIQAYPCPNLLYFLCNLNPLPNRIIAKAKIFHSKNQESIIAEFAVIETPIQNMMYSLNVSLSKFAEAANLNYQDISCIEIFLKDEEDIKLTSTKILYAEPFISPQFRQVWYLSTMGVWESHIFSGQHIQTQEIDTFRDEYQYKQVEFYTHSYGKFTLNSGILSENYQQYLAFQITHSEKIFILEPDGTYQQIIKLNKSVQTYDSTEIDEHLTFEFRYIETEI